MSKIITTPDFLIQELEAALGAHKLEVIESIVSRYISDAVIAVTTEDIAAQAIAWASSHNEFYYEPIDIDTDGDRYVAIQNSLIQVLDIENVVEYIQDGWDMNSTVSSEGIFDALLLNYAEGELLNLVSAIAADYNEVNNNA